MFSYLLHFYIVLTLVNLNIMNIHYITQPNLKHVVEEILQCLIAFIVPKHSLFIENDCLMRLTYII